MPVTLCPTRGPLHYHAHCRTSPATAGIPPDESAAERVRTAETHDAAGCRPASVSVANRNMHMIEIPESELTFTYSRSAGPGGQNVNKVNSRATLHWNAVETPALPEAVKARFLSRFASRITNSGEVVIHSQRYRDQKRNAADCVLRLQAMIEAVETPPTPRKKTRPSRGANQRRLQEKKVTAQRKQQRQRPATE